MTGHKTYRVGVTELHGAYDEIRQNPPQGFEYTEMRCNGPQYSWMRSPIEGYFDNFVDDNVDIVESVISPVVTKKPWFFSLAVFQEALAFSCLGFPIPKPMRTAFINRLISKDNCHSLLFWSQAGLNTAKSYGGIKSSRVLDKMRVVYPAVRKVELERKNGEDGKFRMLFSGDFFRKGGMNVVDAFTELAKSYPHIELVVCCDTKIDFNGVTDTLKNSYLSVLESHSQIRFLGRIPRDQLLKDIMPVIDVYLLPTYNEAFGFAVLEAMAYGIPVIATNVMALPELISDGDTGLLIDVSDYDIERLFKGYVVYKLPTEFVDTVTRQLTAYLVSLIEDEHGRTAMGQSAQARARTHFSTDARNKIMSKLYQDALEG
ncbi:glycosyltransferase family 4 protein [Alteromonas sp. H39]|uniref:glycosyltransferase family 4 protein n=1 Tax=Alteromonas sp. H39 TaxID=3389876 RepID=UPI0039DFBAE8